MTRSQTKFVVPASPLPLNPKTLKKSIVEEGPRLQEAFDFIKAPIQMLSASLVYAQYIANKLDTRERYVQK